MQTRRQFLAVAGVAAVAGCGGESNGTATDARPTDGEDDGGADTGDSDGSGTSSGLLSFTTPAFDDGETMPERYTGVGEDVSPPLTVESVPEAAETLALVVDDPAANNYVHWLLWNVPADVESIPEGLPQTETLDGLDGARQGENNFGELGYRGPLPPADDGPHTYRFAMSAVDTTLDLSAGNGRGKLEDALDGHVIDTATITGEFDRG